MMTISYRFVRDLSQTIWQTGLQNWLKVVEETRK